jgi:hypothetical protein
MATSTAMYPSVRTAFAELIDYAGLFPPAALELPTASREYQTARSGPHAWMLGRFIVAASQLERAAVAFEAGFSVIVEPTADALASVARMRAHAKTIAALEIPLQNSLSPSRERLSRDEVLDLLGALEADLAVSGLRDLPAFVEIPRTGPWWNVLPEIMNALARFRLAAKLRCGGVTAAAYPSVAEVAIFIAAAQSANVAFKATAGLHHPVRHVDPATGFVMHGFLNLIAAAALAPRADPELLARVIADEDPSAFAFDDESFTWRDQRIELAELQRARDASFVSYGSCSFAEPVEDLTALGLLAPR